MRAWWLIGGWMVLAGSLLIAASGPAKPAKTRPEFRFHGAVIRVTDMEKALAFYSERLGFTAGSGEGMPRTVRLRGDFPLYLRQVPGLPQDSDRSAGGLQFSRAGITFQTSDILRRTEALRAAGVEFLAEEPHRVGVGLAIFFRDPFGTVHSLLQQTEPASEPFEEPRVYNSGFSHPDVAKTRPLYVKTLGFVVRTEDYFPPALPLGHADGSFAFMLHEKPDLRPATSAYPNGPGTTLVFTTPDTEAAAGWLREKAVDVFPPPAAAAPAEALAFRDAYGVVSEIWPAGAAGPAGP